MRVEAGEKYSGKPDEPLQGNSGFRVTPGSLQWKSGGFSMPLRDHFRPPLADFASWEELHGILAGSHCFPAQYHPAQ